MSVITYLDIISNLRSADHRCLFSQPETNLRRLYDLKCGISSCTDSWSVQRMGATIGLLINGEKISAGVCLNIDPRAGIRMAIYIKTHSIFICLPLKRQHSESIGFQLKNGIAAHIPPFHNVHLFIRSRQKENLLPAKRTVIIHIFHIHFHMDSPTQSTRIPYSGNTAWRQSFAGSDPPHDCRQRPDIHNDPLNVP